MKISVSMIAALGLMISMTASAYDFRGLTIGKPIDQNSLALIREASVDLSKNNRISHRQVLSCTPPAGSEQHGLCRGLIPFADSFAEFTLTIQDGVVQAISIVADQSAYHVIEAEAMMKFGSPSSQDKAEMHDASGTAYPSEVLRWKNRRGDEMTVWQYSDRRHSAVTLASATFAAKFQADQKPPSGRL